MAPHSTLSTFDHVRFCDKDRLKLRKPVVEKMRRDRINSCIDQLKKLLEKELHSQDPSTKLEKADILEMTVSFLKQQQRQPNTLAQRDYSEGYSHCWRESLHFLNVHSCRGRPAHELQQHQQDIKQNWSAEFSHSSPSSNSSIKQSLAAQQQLDKPVWRPW